MQTATSELHSVSLCGGRCARCPRRIKRGAAIAWERGLGIRHLECSTRIVLLSSVIAEAPRWRKPRRFRRVRMAAQLAASLAVGVIGGVATGVSVVAALVWMANVTCPIAAVVL